MRYVIFLLVCGFVIFKLDCSVVYDDFLGCIYRVETLINTVRFDFFMSLIFLNLFWIWSIPFLIQFRIIADHIWIRINWFEDILLYLLSRSSFELILTIYEFEKFAVEISFQIRNLWLNQRLNQKNTNLFFRLDFCTALYLPLACVPTTHSPVYFICAYIHLYVCMHIFLGLYFHCDLILLWDWIRTSFGLYLNLKSLFTCTYTVSGFICSLQTFV